jgi:hypothetical protein
MGDFSGCVHPWLKVAAVNGVRERRARRRVVVMEDIGVQLGDNIVIDDEG